MSVLVTSVLLASDGSAPKNVSAGWIGFVVFMALAVAVVFLWLSFRKQLKKIDFEEEPDEAASDSNGSPSNGSPSNDSPPASPS